MFTSVPVNKQYEGYQCLLHKQQKFNVNATHFASLNPILFLNIHLFLVLNSFSFCTSIFFAKNKVTDVMKALVTHKNTQ
jgi:hypothetical protein